MLPEKKQQKLLLKLNDEQIFNQLIQQLNKDLSLANINFKFHNTIQKEDIISHLNKLISKLLKKDYDSYLSFIYRVDVSENNLKKLQTDHFEELTQQITLLVLERELFKIWLKSKFQ